MTLPLAIGGDVFVGLGCYGLIAFADMSGLVDSFRDRASAVVGAPLTRAQIRWLALVAAEIIFYGYGEEVGWRGYVLPRLQRRHSALWASVLISIGWSLWHLPLFLVNESYRQMGVGGTIGWYFSMLTGAILMTWLYNSTDGSILLLAIFPRGEKPNAQRGKLCQINQILQKLDDGSNVVFLDLGHRFLNADGTLPKEIMPDFLHLSPAGYRIWAEAMEPRLAALLAAAPAPAATPLTGDWVWTINGPDGQPISAPLQLAQTGTSVTGQFSAGPDRWLKIENGKVEGTRFSWTVRRTRPNGETAVYEMSGEVSGNAITGKTRTTLDGNETTSDWTARRK